MVEGQLEFVATDDLVKELSRRFDVAVMILSRVDSKSGQDSIAFSARGRKLGCMGAIMYAMHALFEHDCGESDDGH